MSDGRPAPEALEAEDVDRACARADVSKAVPDRFGGDLASPPRRLERGRAKRELRGERRGMGAAGAVACARRVTLAFDSRHALAVEEHVRPVVAVAARDDYVARSDGEELARELFALDRLVRLREDAGL